MALADNPEIRIILADDDDDDRSLFHEALTEADINALLITFSDGDKLMNYIDKIDGKHPNIIFLDINMPCKNGKQCLKEIRSNEKFAEVPVVMFSTSSYIEDIDETFANGANLYVSKPVFFHDEVKILKKIFALDWQNELLKPDKKRFVLYTPSLK